MMRGNLSVQESWLTQPQNLESVTEQHQGEGPRAEDSSHCPQQIEIASQNPCLDLTNDVVSAVPGDHMITTTPQRLELYTATQPLVPKGGWISHSQTTLCPDFRLSINDQGWNPKGTQDRCISRAISNIELSELSHVSLSKDQMIMAELIRRNREMEQNEEEYKKEVETLKNKANTFDHEKKDMVEEITRLRAGLEHAQVEWTQVVSKVEKLKKDLEASRKDSKDVHSNHLNLPKLALTLWENFGDPPV